MALNLNQATGQTFGPSGSNHATGLVPDPGSVAGTTRFLREDATFVALPSFPLSVSNGGTGDSSLTAYAVLCGGTVTTAPIQSIGSLGAVGNVLTSNGPGALPSMQPPSASGAMTLLNTLTASNSTTLSDTSSLTSSYASYEIVFLNLLPATNLVTLEFQVHSGGAFKSSGYLTTCQYVTSGSTGANNGGFTTFIQMSPNGLVNNANGGISGRARIYNPSASNIIGVTGEFAAAQSATVATFGTFGGYWNTAAVVDGFQVLFSSGNITSGTIKIYGIT